MSGNPLVTVLMPCYNAARYFDEAIQSVLNQTYSNLEILLIDDGSKDNTRELIFKYAQLDKRIVPCFNEHNLGLIRTLNKGVSMARGKLIARMDSDDISGLSRVEVMVKEFENSPDLHVLSAGYFSMSAQGTAKRRIFPKALSSEALLFVSFFSTPVNHPCVMARAEVMKANPFDEQYIHSEDYEIFSRLLIKGYHFRNLLEPLYFLRRNPESVSFRFERIQITNHSRISERNIELFFDRKFDYFLHKVMINRISFNVSPELISMAFRQLAELESDFVKIRNSSDTIKREIREFLIEQRIDILLQSFKYANYLNKVRIAFQILFNLNYFLNKRGLQYLKSKVV